MLSKIALAAVTLALALWAHSAWQASVKYDAERLVTEQRVERIKSEIATAADTSSALKNWPDTLAGGERFRMSPVLSAEVQDLWVANRPILFIGRILDISRIDDNLTQLEVEYGSLDQPHMFMATELRISIRCPKEMTAPLLMLAAKDKNPGLTSNVSVIASIASVTAATATDTEGKAIAILTGHGNCKHVIPITERVLFWGASKR